MDEILMDPEKHKEALADPEVFKKYNKLKKALDDQMEEWEQMHQELSALEAEQIKLRNE
jgi:hypothetical protein